MKEDTAGKFSLKLIEPGIIENVVLRGSTLELEDAAWLKAANLELAGQNPYCVLVNIEDLVIVTKEWQSTTASKEYAQKTIAKAIMVRNLAQAILASFYLKFNKPFIKSKAFKNRNDAIEWLRECYKTHCHQHSKEMIV